MIFDLRKPLHLQRLTNGREQTRRAWRQRISRWEDDAFAEVITVAFSPSPVSSAQAPQLRMRFAFHPRRCHQGTAARRTFPLSARKSGTSHSQAPSFQRCRLNFKRFRCGIHGWHWISVLDTIFFGKKSGASDAAHVEYLAGGESRTALVS
jgi:hypothetical protein